MATRRRYIDIPDHARRDFIKWTIGLGAALGLRPWKVFEVQESLVGPAVAATGRQAQGAPERMATRPSSPRSSLDRSIRSSAG